MKRSVCRKVKNDKQKCNTWQGAALNCTNGVSLSISYSFSLQEEQRYLVKFCPFCCCWEHAPRQMVQICESPVFELSNVLCHEYNLFRVCNLFTTGYVHLAPKSHICSQKVHSWNTRMKSYACKCFCQEAHSTLLNYFFAEKIVDTVSYLS